jgi:hypothetical protein
VPPAFGAPKKVAPSGAQWTPAGCRLRWRLGGLYLGCRGAFVAAFRVPAGVEAAAAGLSTLHALLVLRGENGGWCGWLGRWKGRADRTGWVLQLQCTVCRVMRRLLGEAQAPPGHG